MKRSYGIAVAIGLLLAVAIGWIAGRASWVEPAAPASGTVTPATPKVLYYRNPMGLPDTSPVPKKDSMGMDYVPVYAGGDVPVAPGTVVVSLEKVQRLGVRTEPVRTRRLAPRINASATIEVDETRQYAIAPKFEGWVEHLYANQTGMSVKRGQALLRVYSPELLTAQEEFRIAESAAQALQAADPESAATMRRLRDAAKSRLRNWNISGSQLAQLDGTKSAGNLLITSPADAVVVEKPIVQGARFAPGETILRLADLSTVWLIADIPASIASNVAVGQQATFQSPTLPGRSFEGRVSFIQPIVAMQTRTLGVRVELPNADGSLRPGLFGDVSITQEQANPVLVVPRSAVLDSGERQIALVELAEGRYEPRNVELGERAGDFVEIRKGLAEGERVVTSANFLIDAESNLQSALDGFSTHKSHTRPESSAPREPAEPSDAAKPRPSAMEPQAPGSLPHPASPDADHGDPAAADPHAAHSQHEGAH